MMEERFGVFQLDGKDVTLVGPEIQVGQTAPGFTATAINWQRVAPLEDSAGKVRVLAAVPSLETSVCDRETRRFNQEAAALSDDVRIYVVSADLPSTQKRWCGAAGIDRVVTVSDHQQVEFGQKYGCLIKERRVLRRSVFVVGRDDRLVYVDSMKSQGDEPDYAAVLEAARAAL